MRRVTVDSNIFISALNFKGRPLQILRMAGSGEIDVFTSEAIIREVMGVLRRKFAWPAHRVNMAEKSMRNLCIVVEPEMALSAVPSDPDDNRIIECAVTSASGAIITGDKDLLRLQEYGGIKIVTAAEFLTRLP